MNLRLEATAPTITQVRTFVHVEVVYINLFTKENQRQSVASTETQRIPSLFLLRLQCRLATPT